MLNFLFNEYLEEGEKIHYVAHRHPFVLFATIWRPILYAMVAPIILFILFPAFLYFAAAWFFIGFCRVLYQTINWFFDVWLLTNTSVIDLDWNGFFSRCSMRIEYHMVEGVSYEYSGFLQTVFRYGDIYLQRVGNGNLIALKDGMRPRQVESGVLQLQAKYVTDKSYRDHDSLKAMLAEMLHHHVTKNR